METSLKRRYTWSGVPGTERTVRLSHETRQHVPLFVSAGLYGKFDCKFILTDCCMKYCDIDVDADCGGAQPGGQHGDPEREVDLLQVREEGEPAAPSPPGETETE